VSQGVISRMNCRNWTALLLVIPIALSLIAASNAHAQLFGSPGPITVSVDALTRPTKNLHAKLDIPVRPGPLTLYYPKWMPADHSPDGPIPNVAGLKFSAGGKEIAWVQDDVDMYAFNLDVPPGVIFNPASLEFLISAPGPDDRLRRVGLRESLHPDVESGDSVSERVARGELNFQPSLTVPAGWKFNTSLPIASQSGDTITFSPVPLDLLVDSAGAIR